MSVTVTVTYMSVQNLINSDMPRIIRPVRRITRKFNFFGLRKNRNYSSVRVLNSFVISQNKAKESNLKNSQLRFRLEVRYS